MPVVDLTDAAGVTTTGVITAIKDGFRKYVKEYRYHHRTWSYDGRNPGSIRAAEQLAFTFIKAIGKKKNGHLQFTGWVVSIPVFADSAIVIFAPLVKAMSSVTGKSGGRTLHFPWRADFSLTLPGTTDTGTAYSSRTSRVDVGQMIMIGIVILDSNASCDRTILQMGRKEDLSDSDWRRRI